MMVHRLSLINYLWLSNLISTPLSHTRKQIIVKVQVQIKVERWEWYLIRGNDNNWELQRKWTSTSMAMLEDQLPFQNGQQKWVFRKYHYAVSFVILKTSLLLILFNLLVENLHYISVSMLKQERGMSGPM